MIEDVEAIATAASLLLARGAVQTAGGEIMKGGARQLAAATRKVLSRNREDTSDIDVIEEGDSELEVDLLREKLTRALSLEPDEAVRRYSLLMDQVRGELGQQGRISISDNARVMKAVSIENVHGDVTF